MKAFYTLVILITGFLQLSAQNNALNEFHKSFTLDSVSHLRNPAMGWVLYEEGASFLEEHKNYDPEIFWEEMDEVDAANYANILYIRVLWKVMEPEEGKYAWEFNKEYQEYIRKAEERGLKLAFRIFFDNGTPDWVYQAGAKSTLEQPLNLDNDKQPYYDDPVFLEKLQNFIKALAEEYDDPSRVDFVDAYGLGRWGEGHGVTLKDQDNYKNVIEKVTNAYARYFKNILTVYNLSRNDWHYSKPLVFDKLGFLPRRDGIGSHWFDDTERAYLKELFPDKALIGEGTYWFGARDKDTTAHTKEPFLKDPRFPNMKYWTDALSVALDDALSSHSNTFDLRTPFESKVWIEKLPEKVQKFTTYGGYRLYPDSIVVKQDNRKLIIDHFWKNFGVGVLPNNHPNWNNKYKVAFALLDPKTQKVAHTFIDPIANPGKWLKGPLYSYTNFKHEIPKSIEAGKYDLVVSIIDNTTGKVGIKLSVKESQLIKNWGFIKKYSID
ncbi:Beta-galactosidase [Salegentibacter holothuriorum]|uniref:Beta-galactosidase n=1 Tax=Salegentibacter holothuriorum TaxID=241145 RepID=A0A1T5E9N2_9FLAO|nr:beta-galactosidase [Salegentibacter holothuriorum]SKB80510.1 Beta-galactosidase [Salegentibacter holothuriorum]